LFPRVGFGGRDYFRHVVFPLLADQAVRITIVPGNRKRAAICSRPLFGSGQDSVTRPAVE
jgi:hypothetical protein